ncbi:2-(3-amino-3-carboxypropyl)histidine synthase subunit 2-like [Tubulanus polymorphus]|uniref:2-(3-amino-3-carboxypropyl)histidine synthase subunit 2-like n=1 Tax=Tubulanus polymorphus TaxID=672921 RepID=UPI003DA52B36
MSSSGAAFSSDGVEVIQGSLDVPAKPCTSYELLDSVYDIKLSVDWIELHQLSRVSLQFPDELLCDSTAVCQRLQEACNSVEFFILGDTSYGSCCVDEVAAQHYTADSIIHYGHSCLSPTSRFPVLHVFGEAFIDVDDCYEKLSEIFPDKQSKVVVLYDVVYAYAMKKLEKLLTMDYTKIVFSSLNVNGSSEKHDETKTVIDKFGRTFLIDAEIQDYSMFYIGEEGLTLSNFILSFNRSQFYSYNPVSFVGRMENMNVNRSLMRRMCTIEKIKDAKIVGIAVGTLGVSDYQSIINHLQTVLKQAGKRSYTFVLGKLNVAKMANFLEIDAFVLVACAENSLIDSKEFYRPIATPYEVELACNRNREWSVEFESDFRSLLPGGSSFVQLPEKYEETADISLVTGEVRLLGCNDSDDESDEPCQSGTVANRSELHVVSHNKATSAAEFLSSRSWKGVKQKLGETPVVKASQGVKGIASCYENEFS